VSPQLSTRLVLLISLMLGAAKLAQAQSACLPADSNSVHLISYLTVIVTEPRDSLIQQEAGFGGLTANDLSLVTTGPACANAVRAFDSMANTPNSGRRVYLVKIGNKRYAVNDPTTTPGAISPTIVFTTKFAFLSVLLGS
jgi:hypothetical protein